MRGLTMPGRVREKPRRANLRPRVEVLERRQLMAVLADFNGDGYGDMAVGANGENSQAGAVNVIYGTAGGLSPGVKFTQPDQIWTQDSVLNGFEIADVAEPGDQFGRTLAAGDFNTDGYADLAIGVPFENDAAGAVHVLYGSAAGLIAQGSQIWRQGLLGGDDENFDEPGDRFGGSLAVGDFNADGYDDLVVGRPGESIGRQERCGNANVIFGSNSGLTGFGNRVLGHEIGDGVIEQDDARFSSLAVGDFNQDGFDDIAVGSPGEGLAFLQDGNGVVAIYHGTLNGLDPEQFWSQESPGISGELEEGDRFGFSLAAGDFDGDGFDDLAIGVPFEDLGTTVDAGAVHVLYGSGGGLTATGSQLWTQDALADVPEAVDLFGVSLVAGDFNGDGRDELAIGVSREDLPGAVDAGAVNLIFGSTSGLTATGNLLYHQNVTDIEEVAEASDQFGFALGADDFDADGYADLAVGVLRENDSGAVQVLYGAAGGFTAFDQVWTQNSSGVEDSSEAGDFFGVALIGTSGIGNGGFSGAWQDLTQIGNTGAKNQRVQLKGTLLVTNPGTEVTPRSVVRFYLSDDATLSASDQILSEQSVVPLASGQTVKVKLDVKLAKGQSADGKFVIAVVDANNDLLELNEDNNVIVFGPLARKRPGR